MTHPAAVAHPALGPADVLKVSTDMAGTWRSALPRPGWRRPARAGALVLRQPLL